MIFLLAIFIFTSKWSIFVCIYAGCLLLYTFSWLSLDQRHVLLMDKHAYEWKCWVTLYERMWLRFIKPLFPKMPVHFILLSSVKNTSACFTSPSKFHVVRLSTFFPFTRYKVVSHFEAKLSGLGVSHVGRF